MAQTLQLMPFQGQTFNKKDSHGYDFRVQVARAALQQGFQPKTQSFQASSTIHITCTSHPNCPFQISLRRETGDPFAELTFPQHNHALEYLTMEQCQKGEHEIAKLVKKLESLRAQSEPASAPGKQGMNKPKSSPIVIPKPAFGSGYPTTKAARDAIHAFISQFGYGCYQAGGPGRGRLSLRCAHDNRMHHCPFRVIFLREAATSGAWILTEWSEKHNHVGKSFGGGAKKTFPAKKKEKIVQRNTRSENKQTNAKEEEEGGAPRKSSRLSEKLSTRPSRDRELSSPELDDAPHPSTSVKKVSGELLLLKAKLASSSSSTSGMSSGASVFGFPGTKNNELSIEDIKAQNAAKALVLAQKQTELKRLREEKSKREELKRVLDEQEELDRKTKELDEMIMEEMEY